MICGWRHSGTCRKPADRNVSRVGPPGGRTALKRATVLVLGILLVLIVSGWSASMAAEATPLAGTVKDTLGHLKKKLEDLKTDVPKTDSDD